MEEKPEFKACLESSIDLLNTAKYYTKKGKVYNDKLEILIKGIENLLNLSWVGKTD